MHRLMFISLEFSAGTFSGNGVYARSQVRSLCQQQCDLLVLSGKPTGYGAPPQTEGALQLIQVELPVWDRLDRGSGWAELAEKATSPAVVQQVAAFGPLAVMGVDWSSLPTYKALAAAFKASGLAVPPFIYMNYRVYLRTCLPADREFMHRMESEAAAAAARVVALSRSDADFITQHLLPSDSPVPVTVLLPALRSDMASLPLPSDRLQPANPLQAIKQGTDTKASWHNPNASLLTSQYGTEDSAQPTASAIAAAPTADLCGHPTRQGCTPQSSAMSTASTLDVEAAQSTAAQSTAARSPADQAQSTAAQAQSTADQAQSTVDQAHSTADQAQSTAAQAQAQSTAAQAQSPAEQAQSTAAQAQAQAPATKGTAACQAATAADDIPIQPLNNQTADGPCISPSIGRRSTPFSTSEPESSRLSKRRQDASAVTLEAFPHHDRPLQRDVAVSRSMGDARELAESRQDKLQQATQHGPSTSVANDCCETGAESGELPKDCEQRPYLTCCVRLSEEKDPHRFINIVEELARQGSLERLGIVPLMCASANTPYAQDLVTRLQAAAPSAVSHSQFLGPAQLAQRSMLCTCPAFSRCERVQRVDLFVSGIYKQTRLNIHPCLYDAYGMTIVEAASQGAPSLVNCGGAVGASDLLTAPSEIFATDMSVPACDLAHQVAELWQNPFKLTEVGQAAVEKARSWTEAANAARLLSLVQCAVVPDMS